MPCAPGPGDQAASTGSGAQAWASRPGPLDPLRVVGTSWPRGPASPWPLLRVSLARGFVGLPVLRGDRERPAGSGLGAPAFSGG